MKCKKCGADIYERTNGRCIRCGLSEKDEIKKVEAEKDRTTISKFEIVNVLYRKVFGETDKKVIFKKLRHFFIASFLLWAIFYPFFYFDLSNKCFIKIMPGIIEPNNLTIKKGVRYLKQNFSNQYSDFCKNVETIDPGVGCGGFGGGCFYHDSPDTITISTPVGKYKIAAKVIIHETCHVIQKKENREMSESECYERDSIIPWQDD